MQWSFLGPLMLFHSSGVSFMVVILYYGHWLTWLALFSILDASCVTNVSSLPSPRREALQQVSTLPIILVSITTPPVYLLWPMRCLPATESCLFIAEDSRCQVFIAENKMQLDKILKVWYIHCLVSKHSIFTPLVWFCVWVFILWFFLVLKWSVSSSPFDLLCLIITVLFSVLAAGEGSSTQSEGYSPVSSWWGWRGAESTGSHVLARVLWLWKS